MRRRPQHRFIVLLLATCLVTASTVTAYGGLSADKARERAGELKNDGVRAYQEGRLADAIRDLSAAIDINLNDFFAHYYLGLALRDTARYSEARRVLEVAAELDPGYLQIYVALGDVALGQGDPGTARAWFQKALNRQASYSPALDGLGRLAEARADTDEAIKRYREAIKSNHGFPLPYVHLGEIFVRQGRQREAIELFQEAIRFRPDFARAYRFLGVTFAALGHRNEATAFLEEALRIEPENLEVRLALAQLLLDWDEPHRAREQFEAAYRFAPHQHEALVGLARLERHVENYERALALLASAAAMEELDDGQQLDILTLVANYEHEQRQRDKLLAAVAADESGTDGAHARLALARLHRDTGDVDGALDLCRQTLDPLGRPAGLVFECGFYALRARDFGPAVELLSEAALLDPAEERTRIDLGLAYKGLGRLNSAVRSYREALELNPRSVEALIFLGNAYYQLDDLEEAEQAYRGALQLVNDTAVLERLQTVLLDLEQRRLAAEPVPGEEATDDADAAGVAAAAGTAAAVGSDQSDAADERSP